MKRLLRVSFDIFISSLTPIILWFLIGIVFDKNLTNVFTITYPFQCLPGIITSIFGVGANVCKYKDKNKNADDNGIFYGTIITIILFGFLAFNSGNYINFMNMDKDIYLIFTRYSIIQIMLQVIMQLILTKLYYLEDNKKANLITILFNTLNLVVLTLTSLITKNQLLATTLTLICLSIFDIVIFILNVKKIDYKLNIKNCFKYDAASCSISILFFIMYLFGFSNSFSYGTKYVTAITFATLVTDIQWDITGAIKTVVKIDVVKKQFNYKEHFKNVSILDTILISSVILLSFILYPFYKPDLSIVSIFIALHLLDYATMVTTKIKMCYLEIERSAVKTTTNVIIAYVMRTFISFLPTPFCTIIGQISASAYEFIYANLTYNKFIKANKK